MNRGGRPGTSSSKRGSVRLYRDLLQLYPSAFRRRFGRDMTECFADEYAMAVAKGRLDVLALWCTTAGHALVGAALQWYAWLVRPSRLVAGLHPALPTSRGNGPMSGFSQDIRYGLRMLSLNLGFTVVVVLTLALGIAANTVIYGVVKAVLLQPLPYEDGDRLVKVWESRTPPGGDLRPISIAYPTFTDWRAKNRVFEEMAAYTQFSGGLTLTGASEPVQLETVEVTSAFFDVLGVLPAYGRTFSSEVDEPATSRRVVLSNGLWQRRFGADPGLVGESIVLDGEAYAVVGIMPRGFWFEPRSGVFPNSGISVDIWVPLASTPTFLSFRDMRQAHWLSTIARLAPGITLEQSRSNMRSIARRIREENPRFPEDWSAYVRLWHDELVGHYRVTLLTLLGAVGFVLLIACANVANLLLVRCTARQRETAIRVALGAGRLRLIRQFLTESVVLATLGGALGLLVAWGGIRLVVAISPAEIPRLDQAGIDAWVVGFAFGLSLLTSLIFGLAPALHGSAPRLSEALKDGNTWLGGLAPERSRNLMAVAEIALAVVLLVGAGLMIRTFLSLRAVESGFDERGVLTARIRVPVWKYPEDALVASFFRQILERVEALPGVDSAGIVSNLPRGGTSGGLFFADGDSPPPREDMAWAQLQVVSPGYFQALGIPVSEGRLFTESDSPESPTVAIISASLADVYWPNQVPIGQRIRLNWDRERVIEIVGIAGDVVDPLGPQDFQTSSGVTPVLYLSYLQLPERSMFLAVHTTADPLSLAEPVRDEIWQIDADQPVADIVTMEGLLAQSISRPHFYMRLFSIFGAVALVMVGIGVYGVLDYSVSQRTFEIGVRMALGAEAGNVLRVVVRQGLLLAFAGVIIGVAAALGLTRLIASLLYEISPLDPWTFAAVPAILMVVAVLACYLPARRATNVDPVQALR